MVFAVGPLTGSGAPCSSRVNITSLSTFTRGNLVVDAHMGGFFAAWMKFAGYDALIIEGQADNPVWIHIDDDQVSIEDASFYGEKELVKQQKNFVLKQALKRVLLLLALQVKTLSLFQDLSIVVTTVVVLELVPYLVLKIKSDCG